MSKFAAKKLILASSSPRRQELIATLGLPFEIRVSDAPEDTEPDMSPAEIVEQLSVRKAAAVCELYSAEQRAEGLVIGSDTIVVLDDQVLGKPTGLEDAVRTLKALQGKAHYVYSGIACINLSSGHDMHSHWVTELHTKLSSLQKDQAAEADMKASSLQTERHTDTKEPLKKTGDDELAIPFGDRGQYRILSESPSGQPAVIVGHTVSKVTFRPMSAEEIVAYVQTGEPLDKAGSYGVQGLGAVFIEKIEGDFYSVMGLPLNLLYQMLLRFGVSPFQV